MLLVTVYALFADDCRTVFLSKKLDSVVDSLMLVSMIFFFLEIIVVSLFQEGYFLGFYFWLDLASTISLITDIGFLWEEITNAQDY